MPVAGGGGDAAMTALKAMAAAGNYPTASQMLGYTVLDYAAAGKMGDPDRHRQEGRLGQGPFRHRLSEILRLRRQMGRRPGQRPFGELAVDQ